MPPKPGWNRKSFSPGPFNSCQAKPGPDGPHKEKGRQFRRPLAPLQLIHVYAAVLTTSSGSPGLVSGRPCKNGKATASTSSMRLA
jgi:hypothetical protein